MFWIFVSTKKIVSTLIAFWKHVADILSNFMWKNWSKTPFPVSTVSWVMLTAQSVWNVYYVLYVYRSDSDQNTFTVGNLPNGVNYYVTFTCGTCGDGWVRIIMLLKKSIILMSVSRKFQISSANKMIRYSVILDNNKLLYRGLTYTLSPNPSNQTCFQNGTVSYDCKK